MVDLSKFVGQEDVEFTLSNGEVIVGKVIPNDEYDCPYIVRGGPFVDCVYTKVYTRDGYYWKDKRNSSYNIIKVKPISTDIQKLEKQIEEYQNKLQELQSQVEEMKAKEEANKLPKMFDRDHAINFLDGFRYDDLFNAFTWAGTPQGYNYWSNLFNDLQSGKIQKAPDEAIMNIQSWVIQSFIQK